MASEPKKRKTFDLRLTKFELVHLRDLFSVLLPLDLKQTVSQMLAATEDRSMVEARFWQKIAAACAAAEIPLDDGAPDFICAAASAPPIGVFRLAHDPDESAGQASSEKTVFDEAQSEEEE